MSNTLASCEVETPEGGIEKSDIKEVEEEVIHNNNNGIISTENNINKEEPPPPPSKDLDSEETTSEKEEGQQETTSDQEACAEACECEIGTCEDDSNPTDTQNTTQNIPIKKKKRRSRKSTLSQHLPRHSSSPELPTHKINTNKSTAQPNILSDSQTTTTTTTVSDGATSPKHPLNTMTKSSSEPLPLTADIASLINENSSTPSSSSSSPKNLTSLPPNMAPHSPYDTSHIPQHLLDLTPPPTRGRSNAFYGSKAPPPLLHSHSDGAAIASQQTSNTIAARRNTTTAGMMMMMANGGVVPAGMQLSLSIPEPSCSGISKPKMFNYWRSLSNSNCEKVIHHSKRFLVGFAEAIGRRPTMEDCMVVNGSFRGRGHEDYFALFDGHGGKDAADFAALHLHEILAEKLKTLNPVKSLKEAFNETHNIIADQKIIGGTTAVVALFIGKKGFIANVGDTRAVLCRDGVPLRVSLDHKPELPAEMSRIRKLGGTVTTTYNSAGQATSRVNGMLAVSRALGDAVLSPYVSSEPEIHGPLNLDTESRNQFVVLACDGVWDVLSDEEATSIVAPIANPEIASRRLRDEAFARGSTDNISVMVIRCPPFPPCD